MLCPRCDLRGVIGCSGGGKATLSRTLAKVWVAPLPVVTLCRPGDVNALLAAFDAAV